ncbi:MAG TPA: NAD(P)/FAD-dependent oxidoreductase [Bacteroidales bacterium]|nr:NAD(P)/FAD-dependent oxidoreductase [Bacteroidales bacterium]
MDNKFDVIIIGSGLGGLQCGYILSREGMKVCILEQHSQIGGCLQNFTRDNCVFDTGVHFIGGLDEGQVLNRYFKYFGLMDKLDLKRMDANGFDTINFAGDPVEYKFAMGHEHFVDGLCHHFPSERKELEKYVGKLKDICNHFPLYSIRENEFQVSELQLFSENAFDYIRSVTHNRKLQNVLAGSNPLYAGIPEKTPLYVHALVNNSFIESSWRVVKGSSHIATILAESIIENGGTILKKSKVEEFIFDNKKLTGVKLTNGESFFATNIISSIHPAKTIEMVDRTKIRSAYRERILNLENTTSNFIMYIVFKKDAFEYLNHNVYYYKNNNVWYSHDVRGKGWPNNYLLITPSSEQQQNFADCATILTYMSMDEVRRWEHTTIEHRGDDYQAFKQQKAEQLLDTVEIRFPGFRSTIKKYYTSSPLTFRDYTGTVDGSIYGVAKDCHEPLKTLIMPRTKIPNLFLTGQSIILHGVLGVTIGSVTTCAELLGMKYLVEKINNT